MNNLTNEQVELITEIFAGYHLNFVSAKDALQDLEDVLGSLSGS